MGKGLFITLGPSSLKVNYLVSIKYYTFSLRILHSLVVFLVAPSWYSHVTFGLYQGDTGISLVWSPLGSPWGSKLDVAIIERRSWKSGQNDGALALDCYKAWIAFDVGVGYIFLMGDSAEQYSIFVGNKAFVGTEQLPHACIDNRELESCFVAHDEISHCFTWLCLFLPLFSLGNC